MPISTIAPACSATRLLPIDPLRPNKLQSVHPSAQLQCKAPRSRAWRTQRRLGGFLARARRDGSAGTLQPAGEQAPPATRPTRQPGRENPCQVSEEEERQGVEANAFMCHAPAAAACPAARRPSPPPPADRAPTCLHRRAPCLARRRRRSSCVCRRQRSRTKPPRRPSA